jgi:hypothetical protein
MKTFARQKLDVVNQTRSNLFGWRGQFTVDSRRREASEKASVGRKAVRPRLRARYREILRAEIADTVATPEEIEEELRHLFSTFGP